MLLGELPNELLMLLFSLLRAKDACRLSQAARAWQQRVKEYLAERHHAWRCGVLLLDWAERAVLRVRQLSAIEAEYFHGHALLRPCAHAHAAAADHVQLQFT